VDVAVVGGADVRRDVEVVVGVGCERTVDR
jgi:hypothetical protein